MDINKKLNKYLNKYLKSDLISSKKFKKADLYFEDYECSFDSSINNYIDNNKDDSFQTYLFKLIDERGLKDSDVYNKVDMDRRLFSKIRSNEGYHPSKETVILLGIALELDEDEIDNLLKKASYSLPMNTTFDLIIRFCFKEKIYDLNKINEFLFDHDCKLLHE